MSTVDIDLVHVEDTTNFTKNSGASSFHAVRSKDSIDVVRVYAGFIDQTVNITASELPKTRNI